MAPASIRRRCAKSIPRLGKIAEQARKIAEDRIALMTEARELADAVARLDPPVVDVEALARTPMPRQDGS